MIREQILVREICRRGGEKRGEHSMQGEEIRESEKFK